MDTFQGQCEVHRHKSGKPTVSKRFPSLRIRPAGRYAAAKKTENTAAGTLRFDFSVGSHVLPSLQGAEQSDLIGVLDVGAYRDAEGQASDLDIQGAEQTGDVHGGGLSLHVGVGGYDDLLDGALLDSL